MARMLALFVVLVLAGLGHAGQPLAQHLLRCASTTDMTELSPKLHAWAASIPEDESQRVLSAFGRVQCEANRLVAAGMVGEDGAKDRDMALALKTTLPSLVNRVRLASTTFASGKHFLAQSLFEEVLEQTLQEEAICRIVSGCYAHAAQTKPRGPGEEPSLREMLQVMTCRRACQNAGKLLDVRRAAFVYLGAAHEELGRLEHAELAFASFLEMTSDPVIEKRVRVIRSIQSIPVKGVTDQLAEQQENDAIDLGALRAFAQLVERDSAENAALATLSTAVPEARPEELISVITAGSCKDSDTKCKQWADRGECDSNMRWMLPNCPRSCHTCQSTGSTEHCVDSSTECAVWAEQGECEKNPVWMRANCVVSCNSCEPARALPLGELFGTGKERICADLHPECPGWARDGECESNPVWQGKFCQKSCKVCDEPEPTGFEDQVLDDIITQQECDKLITLVKTAGKFGDGYNGDEQPMSPRELFAGIDPKHAVELVKSGKASKELVLLMIDVAEKVLRLTQDLTQLPELKFDYSHLVRRTLAPGAVPDDGSTFSHPIHGDNCNQGATPTECIRAPPAYTTRDVSSVLFLNSDFEGGRFFFADDFDGTNKRFVHPQCGRLAVFNSTHLHGVTGLEGKGNERYALAQWFTLSTNPTSLADFRNQLFEGRPERSDDEL